MNTPTPRQRDLFDPTTERSTGGSDIHIRENTRPEVLNRPDNSVEVRVPRRFNIDGKVLRNPIQQLQHEKHTRNVTLTAYRRRRTEGYIAKDDKGQHTFITAKRTAALAGADSALHVPSATTLASISSASASDDVAWLNPRPKNPATLDVHQMDGACQKISTGWPSKFQLREYRISQDGQVSKGLRRPQVGAVHAVLAHWSVTNGAATVVMPTGTGKTDTMLALLTCVGIDRLLVVVPNAALRDQIVGKFVSLGVLKDCGCLDDDAEYPVVAALLHKPKIVAEVDMVFRRANVIVSTMQVVGQCSPQIQSRIAELVSHLFIDEAHHIGAKTWYEFKGKFAAKPVVQFTATPFRTDGRRIDGKFIYTYPLCHRAHTRKQRLKRDFG